MYFVGRAISGSESVTQATIECAIFLRNWPGYNKKKTNPENYNNNVKTMKSLVCGN